MRVSIQIDDQQADLVTTEAAVGQPTAAAAEVPAASGPGAPPAELAARAAAAGALSAGPAPAGGAQGGAPPLPTMVPGIPATSPVGAVPEVAADLPAGAAGPTVGEGSPVVVAAEDGHEDEDLEDDQ